MTMGRVTDKGHGRSHNAWRERDDVSYLELYHKIVQKPLKLYEFNVGPETEVDLMDTNIENVPYATILLPPLFLPLFHHSHHVFR